MSGKSFSCAVAVLGVAAFGIGGAWAFGWPHGFFTAIAHFPPYNPHLFHDLGAFQLGVAAALAGGLWWRDALASGLLGATVAMVVHGASHVMDEGLWSGSVQMWVLVAAALLFVAALAVHIRRSARTGAAQRG